MASPTAKHEPVDHQRPRDDLDAQDADVSLIQPSLGSGDHSRNGYYTDHVLEAGTENPYGDTTESDGGLRHMPLSEVIPRPWQSYRQIEIASYVSVVLFLLTGVFAVKFARRGRMHQSKGLMGMAQRDLRLAVRLIYASICFGLVLYLIIIPVAAS